MRRQWTVFGTVLGTGLGSVMLLAACSSTLGGEAGEPVVLPRTCAEGPHCVTGQVTDQFSNAIEGVTCSVIGQRGEGYAAKTDARGFFYLDRLLNPPTRMRCSKPGLETAIEDLLPKPKGQAYALYINLRRIGDADCSCDPNALVGGRDPCPPEQCH